MSDRAEPTKREVKRSRSSIRRTLRWFVWSAVPITLFGVVILYAERRQEVSPVARGAVLAASSGCFACHSRSEGDQRGNFRRLEDGTWRARAIPTLWENGLDEVAVLTDWIANGVPAEEAQRHRQLFIQMPAYRGHLSAEDIDAVSAWILSEAIRLSSSSPLRASAQPTGTPRATADEILVEGDRLSRLHGCYQCHGELGQGGVSNPASFKGYVAGFFGHDFNALTSGGDRQEVRYWIDRGRGRALESGVTGRLASLFLDRQAIKMPAYEHRLTEQEKNILTDYLLALNKAGPLPAKELERRLKLLTEDPPEKP